MEINPLTQRQVDKMNADIDKKLKDETFTVEDMNKAVDTIIKTSAEAVRLISKMDPDTKPVVKSAHKQFISDTTRISLLIKRAMYREITGREDIAL